MREVIGGPHAMLRANLPTPALRLRDPYRRRKGIIHIEFTLSCVVTMQERFLMRNAPHNTAQSTLGRKAALVAGLLGITASLGGCARDGQIDVSSGVGITASLDGCPIVAIAEGTGDMTVFKDGTDISAANIDVVAAITNVRATCGASADSMQVVSNATFDVRVTRRNAAGARTVILPYYSVIMRGGRDIVAKKVGSVTVTFADGQSVAMASASASSVMDASLTRLPDDVREKITRRREAGDVDAAIDPLADPVVRDALAKVSYEHLIGFQLSDSQLRYNATR